MVLLNLLLVLIVLFFSILAGVWAVKKSAGKKIVNFAILLVSFFCTALILSAGLFDFVGNFLLDLVIKEGSMLENAATIKSLLSSTGNFFARILVFDLVFWILYVSLKGIHCIVLKCCKFEERYKFYKPSANKGLTITAGIIGGVTVWFLCLFSILPFFSISTMITPALKIASSENYSDTYAYEVAKTINEDYFIFTEDAYVIKAARYTGAGFVLDAAVDIMAGSRIENGEENVNYNVHDVLTGTTTSLAKGMIVYERQLKKDRNYSDFVVLLEVVEDGATSPVFIGAASDLLSASEIQTQENGDLMQSIFAKIIEHYTGDDGSANLKNDMLVINDVLSQFIEYNKDNKLDMEGIGNSFIEFVTKGDTEEIVETLSQLSSFNDVMVLSSNYGVKLLCETMGIPMNKEEAYENLTNDVLRVLNDKTQGEIDFEMLDGFIDYLSNQSMSVEEYRNENYVEGEGDDVAYVNYDRYIKTVNELNGVLKKYKLTEESELVYYTNSKLYKYDESTDTWSAVNDSQNNILKHDLFTQYVITESDGFISGDENQYTLNELNLSANEFAEKIQEDDEFSETTKGYNINIAKALTSIENFNSDFIYGDEILETIGNSEGTQEGDVEELKGIFSGVIDLLDIAKDEDIVGALLSNFGDVGKMIDCLSNYSVTEEVPELLLQALAQNEEFSKYLLSESIVAITENVKNGTSSYEELFSSIQALYNIANEIL